MNPRRTQGEAFRRLVRTRLERRARDHARTHLSEPVLTMRASIAYLTTTAATTSPTFAAGSGEWPAQRADASHGAGAHRLELLGWHRGERAVYLSEDVGGALPVIHVVRTRGEQAGRMIAMRSWYIDHAADGAADPLEALDRRLTALRGELVAMDEVEPDPWCLTTRVVQRRALRLPGGGLPIRKFALQLTVEPIVSARPATRGRTVVTAYLRPRAHLERAWAIPGEPLALTRVSYVGVPEGVGHDKHVALLVPRELH